MRVLGALLYHVAKVGAVKAGDVFVRIAQPELIENVVPHALRRTGGEGGDGNIGEVLAQAGELAVLRAELVAPFGDAVRLIDGEQREWHLFEPAHGVFAGQAFGREIEQPESALRGGAHHGALLFGRLRAIEHGGRDAHIGELRHLVLHEGNERADH